MCITPHRHLGVLWGRFFMHINNANNKYVAILV